MTVMSGKLGLARGGAEGGSLERISEHFLVDSYRVRILKHPWKGYVGVEPNQTVGNCANGQISEDKRELGVIWATGG